MNQRFVKLLATYFVQEQARKSIEFEMGKPDAKLWAELRGAVPVIIGYMTIEEAEAALARWMHVSTAEPTFTHGIHEATCKCGGVGCYACAPPECR